MAAKFALVLCATALFAQTAFALGGCGCGNGNGVGYVGIGNGCSGAYGGTYGAGVGAGYGGGVASTGGGLSVTSSSPLSPSGLSVLSENSYEGALNVGGNLPFLGTIALEGLLPSVGSGAVSYGCGNGGVGISSEAPAVSGILSGQDFAPSVALASNAGAGIGYGAYGAAGNGIGLGGYGAGLGGYGTGLGGYGTGCGCGAGIAGIAGNSCGCGY